jgi:hypothetical protein
MRQRRRSDIVSGDSGDQLPSPSQNHKRRKLGGTQLGSVLVNIDGLDSDSEAKESKSSTHLASKKTGSEPREHVDGAATRDGAKRVVHPDPARNESGRRKGQSAEHAPGSASVHFRGVSYNATTAEVQEYLARCGECPVRAVRWPNERSKNCGLVLVLAPRIAFLSSHLLRIIRLAGILYRILTFPNS